MKRSNTLLLILSLMMLLAVFITDHLLALQYAKINLSDPYKNFQQLRVSPFTSLVISGGNGYSIRVQQGNSYGIMLRNSRASFFSKMEQHDTLQINFTVAGQNYQKPEMTTVGIIITVPKIKFIQLSGTNNEIGPFRQDSLKIVQDKNTYTQLKQLSIDHLTLEGTGSSYFDFKTADDITQLNIDMKNSASINFHEAHFKYFESRLIDSAAIVLYGSSLKNFLNSRELYEK